MKIPFAEVNLRLESGRTDFEEPRCFVFGSEDAVKRVYGASSVRPMLDFGQSMVIAVHRGVQRSGGYGLEVEAVEAEGDQITVHVRRVNPAPGAFVTMALTYPRKLIRVERADLGGDGPWTFHFADEKGHIFATVHEQV